MSERYIIKENHIGDRVTWLVIDTKLDTPVTWSRSKRVAQADADRMNGKVPA